MEAKVFVHLHGVSEEELFQLLQGIRDAEQAHFREKQVGIWVETVPEISSEEAAALFRRLTPPFQTVSEGVLWKGPATPARWVPSA